ncbi:patatin-like phospholipase family protein [Rhodococcus sp. G-MC3]|uniref:patatin-like phospholipase family protein n=1 Tax=Rhodococcus sp. G-MC3 TaxID=3046209 RepID=UPI0024BA4B25|nr:patatin-like phospholipase family protein [Rhodococcus sp. G-MC3]MDJ0392651.1 patatin-like phospholipase family protein [Rhodococcus sp. G-MC3]
MTKYAVAIGCGGTIGAAWCAAVLHSLAEQTGIDPREADVLQGTSGGAEMVTMLAGGVGVQELVDMHRGVARDVRLQAHIAATPRSYPLVPRPGMLNPRLLWTHTGHARATGLAPIGRSDPTWLQDLADAFSDNAGRLPHPNTRMVAFDFLAGERVAFGAPDAPSATAGEALRASWAVPGWMPPVAIGDRRFVDGGVASTASVDLINAADADTVFVIAPMASPAGCRAPGVAGVTEQVLLRRPMSRVLATEIATARKRGMHVVPILASRADLAGLGANFMNRGHRRAAFEAAMISAPTTVRKALTISEDS